ncbi:hypothetical protein HW555_000253 [Spodoptera exigua]|uniref:Uncharacterized protein n=1 Tax=Spodoptera exigua TaxID=7107 RepID=A0A835GV81_SPOEX|nr:hypothetical protein HW555_000253 [Spodoptera exigua]
MYNFKSIDMITVQYIYVSYKKFWHDCITSSGSKQSTETKMKFFVAFVALVAITVASPVSKPVDHDLAHLEAIIAAINSPSTDPATAALLEQQLFDIVSAVSPVDVGPAIVPQPEQEPVEEIAQDVPQPDFGAVTNPVVPSPVVVGPIPEGAPSPLVQIIVNINHASKPEPIPIGPVVEPEPVDIVEVEPVPVQVVDVKPEPVDIVPEPVVEPEPVPVEPVQVEVPTLPEPAVLPDELN